MGLLYDLTVNHPQSATQADTPEEEVVNQMLHPDTKTSMSSYQNILFAAPLAMKAYHYSPANVH